MGGWLKASKKPPRFTTMRWTVCQRFMCTRLAPKGYDLDIKAGSDHGRMNWWLAVLTIVGHAHAVCHHGHIVVEAHVHVVIEAAHVHVVAVAVGHAAGHLIGHAHRARLLLLLLNTHVRHTHVRYATHVESSVHDWHAVVDHRHAASHRLPWCRASGGTPSTENNKHQATDTRHQTLCWRRA